jgi:hypothetical protein
VVASFLFFFFKKVIFNTHALSPHASLENKTLFQSRLSKPDWPIEPGTGHISGPVRPKNRGVDEPEKNRVNWP